MAIHEVTLKANAGIFEGLAKQNMQFHQCIAELIDNAIAARRDDEKFNIRVFLQKQEGDEETVDVWVVDNGRGMSLDIFQDALQLGESATTDSRLNEHGFGMKNALATLSGGNKYWKMWTSPWGQDEVYSAEGPFDAEMAVEDDASFPNEDFLPSTGLSTIVYVPVELDFVQTVQGRGAPAKDLVKLRKWLVEHLGVLYRGYLQPSGDNFEEEGKITVSVGTDHMRVPPIEVPLGNREVERFELELGGKVEELEYHYGTLDEVQRDKLVKGDKCKHYYQGNQQTQGIDIRLGKRVIATCQFESIWSTEDGEEPLSRHNRFNDFVGELRIPDLPRGVLTTTNNKTDFNMEDEDWVKIFQVLDQFRPIEDIRDKTESSLKKAWMDKIEATNPKDDVSDEVAVWPTGAKIDVFRETSAGDVILYEMKTGTGSPHHLYQLKMYWDGLVMQGNEDEYPNEAILLVEDFNKNLEKMANQMNKIDPPKGGNPYNFKIATHEDKDLDG